MDHPISTIVRPIPKLRTLGQAETAAVVGVGIGTLISLVLFGFMIYGIVKFLDRRR